MSAATIPGSGSASEDWQITPENGPKPVSLVIELRRQAFILPWFRFVYAEGNHEQLKVQFASHAVAITGHGLTALLGAIASQRVLRISQPTENEAKFSVRGQMTSAYRRPRNHRNRGEGNSVSRASPEQRPI